jgi:hypothetical protein
MVGRQGLSPASARATKYGFSPRPSGNPEAHCARSFPRRRPYSARFMLEEPAFSAATAGGTYVSRQGAAPRAIGAQVHEKRRA